MSRHCSEAESRRLQKVPHHAHRVDVLRIGRLDRELRHLGHCGHGRLRREDQRRAGLPSPSESEQRHRSVLMTSDSEHSIPWIHRSNLRAALRVTRQCNRGRPRTSRHPRVSGHAGDIRSVATSYKRRPFGGCNLDEIARLPWWSTRRTCHRMRRSRRKPAAA